MIPFLLACALSWLLLVTLIFALPGGAARRAVGWGLPLAGLVLALLVGPGLEPWQRLLLGSVGLLYLLKGTTLLQYPQATLATFSKPGLFLFMSVWPGMDPRPFRCRQAAG